jgi:hypothetical protein
MITYTEIYDDIKTPPTLLAIKKEDDNGNAWSIPIDPANSDYQAYLNKDNPVEHFTPNLS